MARCSQLIPALMSPSTATSELNGPGYQLTPGRHIFTVLDLLGKLNPDLQLVGCTISESADPRMTQVA